MRMYTRQLVAALNCSSKKGGVGGEQNTCYQRGMAERLRNKHTMENYADTKKNVLDLFQIQRDFQYKDMYVA